MKLFAGDLAFGTALSFLVGAFSASAEWDPPAVITVAASAAVLAIIFFRAFWREALIFLLASLCGIFYFHYHGARGVAAVHLPIGAPASFSAIVSDEPQPSEKAMLITAETEPPFAGRVLVSAPPGTDISYGDELRITGTLQEPETATGGTDAVIFLPDLSVIARHRGFWLREKLIDLKHAILKTYRDALPEDQAALLGGITFGSRVFFRKELKAAMALSGTTHLVAISGYNITIVIFAAGSTFGRLLSKRMTFYAAIILLVLFMLMVGDAASGVRAAIMGFLALVAREAGKRFSMRNAITLTAAGMSVIDPRAITANMSFVLSFASLLGVVYIGPPLKRLFRQSDAGFLGWKENAMTTVSAQLAVLPVLINVFGRFSITAVAANIFVLSTVPFTMFLGLLLAILGIVSGPLAFLAGKFTGLVLAYQLGVIRLFAHYAVPLPLPFHDDFAMALYYLLLGAFVFHSGKYGHAEKDKHL